MLVVAIAGRNESNDARPSASVAADLGVRALRWQPHAFSSQIWRLACTSEQGRCACGMRQIISVINIDLEAVTTRDRAGGTRVQVIWGALCFTVARAIVRTMVGCAME
jgi:hypothetical protein